MQIDDEFQKVDTKMMWWTIIIFQMFILFIKYAPFLFKIGEDLNIDN
jgi:hypothetical protein